MQTEHQTQLSSAIRAVEDQALRHAVTVCGERRPKYLRLYLALCVRDYGAGSSITTKAQRLLADAEQVAELERMAGL